VNLPPPIPSSTKKSLAGFLSFYVLLFALDGVISIADDSLILLFASHAIAPLRSLVGSAVFMMGLLVYVLMAFICMIPKRIFLTLTLYPIVGMLIMILGSIYYYRDHQSIALGLSVLQLFLTVYIIIAMQGGLRFQWPWVKEGLLGDKGFSWKNFFGFVSLNAFVFLPGVVLYLALCASLAVDHFSDGFVALHWDRVSVKAKSYSRGDGKTIDLVPMAHIGDASFYKKISGSFPEDAVVLLEGVTDEKKNLTTKWSYSEVAASLGLVEQKNEFVPTKSKSRRADVDVSQFSKETLDFLREVGEFYSSEVTIEKIIQINKKPRKPETFQKIWEDILIKRNEYLLSEVHKELAKSDHLVIPWGAAHMPGISQGIREDGFKVSRSTEYDVIYFKTVWDRIKEPPHKKNKS
jgi:hypothetical protein